MQVRHLPDTAPKMVVYQKIMGRKDEKPVLEKVLAYWFNTLGDFCKESFDPLDLHILVRGSQNISRRA